MDYKLLEKIESSIKKSGCDTYLVELTFKDETRVVLEKQSKCNDRKIGFTP